MTYRDLMTEHKRGTIREDVMIANAYATDAIYSQDCPNSDLTKYEWRRKSLSRWSRAIHEGIVVG